MTGVQIFVTLWGHGQQLYFTSIIQVEDIHEKLYPAI